MTQKMIFYFKIFKIYLEYLVGENLLDKATFLKTNKKKLFLHIFKSNYFIVLSIKCFFVFVNFISIIISFKSIFNNEKKISNKIIKIISKIFNLYEKKLKELTFAIFHIQNEEFNEKTKFLNVNNFNLNKNDIFDAIIIGSGPSGSITANKLKTKFDKVLILEKGNSFSHYSTYFLLVFLHPLS